MNVYPTALTKLTEQHVNAYYERLIELRREKPDVFATLSPAARLALSYYEAEKRRQALINDELTTLPPAA